MAHETSDGPFCPELHCGMLMAAAHFQLRLDVACYAARQQRCDLNQSLHSLNLWLDSDRAIRAK